LATCGLAMCGLASLLSSRLRGSAHSAYSNVSLPEQSG
jgi:hypothetical protein